MIQTVKNIAIQKSALPEMEITWMTSQILKYYKFLAKEILTNCINHENEIIICQVYIRLPLEKKNLLTNKTFY